MNSLFIANGRASLNNIRLFNDGNRIIMIEVACSFLMQFKRSYMTHIKRISWFKRKGYVWVSFMFFIFSLALHWIFGWKVYVQEQFEHHQPPLFSDFFTVMMRDTMENWQSEFLQLIWQVAGLAFLLYVGSPQSKEGDERKEEKLDYIIKKLDPSNYEKLIAEWEQKFPKN